VDARHVDIADNDEEPQRAAEIANSDANVVTGFGAADVAGSRVTVVHPATAGTASK
jgi:capsular polysaccharide biosynthesis protein